MNNRFQVSYPPDKIDPGWAWKGLNSKTPPLFLTPLEAAQMSNVWLRNQEIRSIPPFNLVFPGPDPNNATLGQTSFQDSNGTLHTCAFTSFGLWQLGPFNSIPVPNPWRFFVGPTP